MRLVATVFFGIATVLLVALILLLPSYLSINRQLANSIVQRSEYYSGRDAESEEQNRLLVEESKVLADELVRHHNARFIVTDLFESILTSNSSGITFTTLSYEAGTGKEASRLTVSGIAPSRQNLVTFSERLESVPHIADVELPVRSFVESTDVPFTIIVTLEGRRGNDNTE